LLIEYHQTPSLLKLLGFKNRMQDELKKTVDVIRYPINSNNLYYRNFKIGKEVPLYG
jgi:predicted nucleotidyltransferase